MHSRAIGLTVIVLLATSCSSMSSGPKQVSPSTQASVSMQLKRPLSVQETPVPIESNPPGDIPDTQAFVRYVSLQDGYQVDAPEGWSRSITGAAVTFRDKYDSEQVRLIVVNPRQERSALLAEVEKSAAAVRISRNASVSLPAGNATLIEYTCNSEADEVTGKKIRLQAEAFVFQQRTGGSLKERSSRKTAFLNLRAPAGSDNVDQWNRIAHSFHWL